MSSLVSSSVSSVWNTLLPDVHTACALSSCCHHCGDTLSQRPSLTTLWNKNHLLSLPYFLPSSYYHLPRKYHLLCVSPLYWKNSVGTRRVCQLWSDVWARSGCTTHHCWVKAERVGVWRLLGRGIVRYGVFAVFCATWLLRNPVLSSLPLTLRSPFIYSVNIWVTVYVPSTGRLWRSTWAVWQACSSVAYSLSRHGPRRWQVPCAVTQVCTNSCHLSHLSLGRAEEDKPTLPGFQLSINT